MEPQHINGSTIEIKIKYTSNDQRRRSTSLPQKIAPEVQVRVEELKDLILSNLEPTPPSPPPIVELDTAPVKLSTKKSESSVHLQRSPERMPKKIMRRGNTSPGLMPEEKGVAQDICFYMNETEHTHQKASQLIPSNFLINFFRGGEDKSLPPGCCFNTISVGSAKGTQHIKFTEGESIQDYLIKLAKSIYELGFIEKQPNERQINENLDFLHDIVTSQMRIFQEFEWTKILKTTREAAQKISRETKEKDLIRDLAAFCQYVTEVAGKINAPGAADETSEHEVSMFFKIAKKERFVDAEFFPKNYGEEINSLLAVHFPAWPVMQILNPAVGSTIDAFMSIWPELSHNASELGLLAEHQGAFPTCIGMRKCDNVDHLRAGITITKPHTAIVAHHLCVNVVMHYIGQDKIFCRLPLGDMKFRVQYPVKPHSREKKEEPLLKAVEIHLTQVSYNKEADLTLDVMDNAPLLEAYHKALLAYRKAIEDTPRKGKIAMRSGSILFPMKKGKTRT